MNLKPLLDAHPLVQVHVAAAFSALVLGSAQFALRKGTTAHRATGWIWATLMALLAASSFWITSRHPLFGPFSWIHVLSVATLVALPIAVLHARRSRISHHRWSMIGIFVGALVVAGLFTLMPGRIMHQVALGSAGAPSP
jgi:uncharacterized membrane protein